MSESQAFVDRRAVDHIAEDLLIYSQSPERFAVRCTGCGGSGFRPDCGSSRRGGKASAPIHAPPRNAAPTGCDECRGAGWLGIDPTIPTSCKPGSEGKLAVMATRYANGKPLHVVGDCDLTDRLPPCGPMEPLPELPGQKFSQAPVCLVVGSVASGWPDISDASDDFDDEE